MAAERMMQSALPRKDDGADDENMFLLNLVLSILLTEKRRWVLKDGDDVDEVFPPTDLEAGLPLLVLRLLVAAGLQ